MKLCILWIIALLVTAYFPSLAAAQEDQFVCPPGEIQDQAGRCVEGEAQKRRSPVRRGAWCSGAARCRTPNAQPARSRKAGRCVRGRSQKRRSPARHAAWCSGAARCLTSNVQPARSKLRTEGALGAKHRRREALRGTRHGAKGRQMSTPMSSRQDEERTEDALGAKGRGEALRGARPGAAGRQVSALCLRRPRSRKGLAGASRAKVQEEEEPCEARGMVLRGGKCRSPCPAGKIEDEAGRCVRGEVEDE